MPIVESGTSVAPRQRPKGSSAVHGPNPLGLGLPPSPSPRNNITSPQPQQQPIVEQFQANFPQLTPPVVPPQPIQQQTATTTVSAGTVVIPATTPQTSAIVVAATPTVAPPPLTQPTVNQTGNTNTSAIAAQQQQPPPEVLNSLFESSVYPDPFSENAPIAMKNTAGDTVACSSGLGVGVGLGLCVGVGDGLDNIAMSSLSAHHTTVGSTPTKSSMLTVSGVGPSAGSSGTSGHRRNVSDTSAFNK